MGTKKKKSTGRPRGRPPGKSKKTDTVNMVKKNEEQKGNTAPTARTSTRSRATPLRYAENADNDEDGEMGMEMEMDEAAVEKERQEGQQQPTGATKPGRTRPTPRPPTKLKKKPEEDEDDYELIELDGDDDDDDDDDDNEEEEEEGGGGGEENSFAEKMVNNLLGSEGMSIEVGFFRPITHMNQQTIRVIPPRTRRREEKRKRNITMRWK